MISSAHILVFLFLLILLWLLFLTVQLLTIRSRAKILFSIKKPQNLLKLVEDCISKTGEVEDHCERINITAKKISKVSGKGLSKTGFIRYNPFGNVGGDQSFSLCLLDSSDNGFVISSIHSREGTRVYGKTVSSGESHYNLSEEEKKAIKIALKKE